MNKRQARRAALAGAADLLRSALTNGDEWLEEAATPPGHPLTVADYDRVVEAVEDLILDLDRRAGRDKAPAHQAPRWLSGCRCQACLAVTDAS